MKHLHPFKTFENPTNIRPTGHRVLVRMDPIDAKAGGIIVKPDNIVAQEEMGQVNGTLIACGRYAWSDMPEPYAQPGDAVMISKYAGVLVDREDGKYRVIEDLEVTAQLENDHGG